MASESQVSIRLRLEILLEIFRQRNKGLPLAFKQAAVGIRDSRQICRKVSAVQRKSGFQFQELRRGRRVLYHPLGGSRSVQAARVAAIRTYRNRAGWSTGR